MISRQLSDFLEREKYAEATSILSSRLADFLDGQSENGGNECGACFKICYSASRYSARTDCSLCPACYEVTGSPIQSTAALNTLQASTPPRRPTPPRPRSAARPESAQAAREAMEPYQVPHRPAIVPFDSIPRLLSMGPGGLNPTELKRTLDALAALKDEDGNVQLDSLAAWMAPGSKVGGFAPAPAAPAAAPAAEAPAAAEAAPAAAPAPTPKKKFGGLGGGMAKRLGASILNAHKEGKLEAAVDKMDADMAAEEEAAGGAKAE